MRIKPPPNFLAKQPVKSLCALLSMKAHVDTGSASIILPEGSATDVKATRQDSTFVLSSAIVISSMVESLLLTVSPDFRKLLLMISESACSTCKGTTSCKTLLRSLQPPISILRPNL